MEAKAIPKNTHHASAAAEKFIKDVNEYITAQHTALAAAEQAIKADIATSPNASQEVKKLNTKLLAQVHGLVQKTPVKIPKSTSFKDVQSVWKTTFTKLEDIRKILQQYPYPHQIVTLTWGQNVNTMLAGADFKKLKTDNPNYLWH